MVKELIKVEEARELIRIHTVLLNPVVVPLEDAAGLILASDAFSKTDLPPFNQSSMDGYAINFEGWESGQTLKIKGESAAGLSPGMQISNDEAARIFTGAAVPEGADTIVMQEKVTASDDQLIIDDPNLSKGLNFRLKGSDARSGELALEKGSLLTPPAIGFLAGIGISEVEVFPVPSVSIILTGDELQKPGLPLQYGQVYESNSFALKAVLKQSGISSISVFSVEDTLEATARILGQALEQSDVVILTGGVSVGDYDFVVRAASSNQVTPVFHKIRQKPGKPLFFGKKSRKIVFGLPGNPASVLTCFYEYVLPCLGGLTGRDTSLKSQKARLKNAITKPGGLVQFLKAFYNGETVTDLQAQESFRLSSFAKANCLIKLDQDKTAFERNEEVEIHLLPY